MGVFHSKPKGPPPPVDLDAPMSPFEVFMMVLKSKKHPHFRYKCLAGPIIGFAGFGAALACTITSIIYGDAVVGNIGYLKVLYVLAAVMALIWAYFSFDFAFDAMTLDVPPSVTVHISRQTVANVVTFGLYFVIFYENGKRITEGTFPSNAACVLDCEFRWAVYEYFALATACWVLLLGIGQLIMSIWIWHDPLLHLDLSAPPPPDPNAPKPAAASTPAEKKPLVPASGTSADGSITMYHSESDSDHHALGKDGQLSSDDEGPLMGRLQPKGTGEALQMGKRRSTRARRKEDRRRRQSREEGREMADRDARRAERGVYDRV